MATIITRETGATAVNRTLTNTELDNNFINLNADIATRIPSSEKAAANGVATLDATGKVPSTQLPSYVDDVLEAANLAAFPATGETGKIYVALDTNKAYRWSGSTYIYITSGAVDSVAGRTGAVVLSKSDVGLSNVDNTADADKNVLTATKWASARTLSITGDISGSASIDGSANVSITGTLPATGVAAGSYGSATAIPVITVDAKGRLTLVSTVAVSIPSGSISVTGGDFTMSGSTGSPITNATLATVNSNVGTFNTVTVNAKGLVTSASNVAYLTSYTETDTLATVTARGASTSTKMDANGGIYAPKIGIASSNLADATNGAPWYGIGASTSTGWYGNQQTVQLAGYYGLVIKTANTQLDFDMSGGTSSINVSTGTLKVAGNTVYHTGNVPGWITGYTETDTLATVTARGATTSTAVTLSSSGNHFGGHFYLDAYDAAGNHYPHFSDGSSASGSKVNWRLYSGGTNSVTHQWTVSNTDFSNNVRSPIFYDLNDTSYYADPNSGSRLLHIFAGNVSSTNDGSWNARLNLVGSQHARLDVVSNSDGIITTMYSHTGQGMGKIGTYSNHPLALMAQGANIGGYVYNGSIRAPIFYDSDNTDYYGDFASTSWMNVVKANVFCGRDSNAYGVYKGYDNNNHFISIRGAVSGTTSSPTISGAHHTTFVEYAESNDSTGWFFKTSSTGNYDVISRITRSYSYFESSVRSPIFYDSDNTGYYTDPASTSNVNAMVSYSYQGNGNVGGTGSASWHPSGIYSAGHNWLYGGINAGGSSVTNMSDARANIFYDYNDTGYYCNPNGRSNFSSLQFDNGNLYMYQGDGTALRIQTAYGWMNIGAQNSSWTHIYADRSFYTNQDWYVNGNLIHHDGNAGRARNNYLMYYQGFTLDANTMDHNATGFTYSNNAPATGPVARFSTGGGYDLWLNAAYSGGNNLYFRTRNGDAGSINGWRALASYGINYADTLYATAYYDANDTGYYIDPNSTSNSALRMRGGALFGPNPTWGAYLYVGTDGRAGTNATVAVTNGNLHIDAQDGYDIYLNHYNGRWTRTNGLYDNQDTAYYLDANSTSRMYQINFNNLYYAPDTSYGFIGTSIYVDTINSGYSTDPLEINYVRGTWAGISHDSLRAPLYYDYNDTGYYVDPNSSSRLYQTVTNISYFGADTNKGYAQGYGTYSSQLHKIARITFDWDSNYNAENHGIFSTDISGYYSDDMSINSYNDINLRIDSNDNDAASYVRFHMHTTGNNQFAYVGYDGGGYLAYFAGSVRSPIFYDSDDTGRYVNPAGDSHVNDFYSHNWFRNYGQQGLYNQDYGGHFYMQSAGIWSMTGNGGNFELQCRANHNSTIRGYLYGDTSNNFGLLNQNGSWKVRVNGSETEIYDYTYTNDLRTYIMYDRNDTGYYVDANSGTSLNGLTTNNHYIRAGSMLYSDHGGWTGEYNKIQWHSSHLYLQNAGGGYLLILRRGDGGERFYCDYNGNVTASGSITAYSDQSLKTNVKTITNARELRRRLRGVTFDWIESGQHSYGLIAQEVEKVIPELVLETQKGTVEGDDSTKIKSVDYSKLVSVLIQDGNEQDEHIEKLEARIARLEALIEKLI